MIANPTRLVLLALVAALAGCVTEDAIRSALERTGQRAVDDAADTSYDAARAKAVKTAEGDKDEKGDEGEKKAQPAEAAPK